MPQDETDPLIPPQYVEAVQLAMNMTQQYAVAQICRRIKRMSFYAAGIGLGVATLGGSVFSQINDLSAEPIDKREIIFILIGATPGLSLTVVALVSALKAARMESLARTKETAMRQSLQRMGYKHVVLAID